MENASYFAQFLNFTTPVKKNDWSKCFRHKTIDTRDMECDPLNFNPHLEKNCSEYVYDNSEWTTTTVSDVSDRST